MQSPFRLGFLAWGLCACTPSDAPRTDASESGMTQMEDTVSSEDGDADAGDGDGEVGDGDGEVGDGDAAVGDGDGDGDRPLDPSFNDERVLNIAHRGGAHEVPEHTLLAYQHALEVGADAVEVDLQVTEDGVPVALHDDTLDRTTDGSGDIAAISFAELQTLDAGYWFTTDGGESYPHRGTGLRVPSFESILESFSGELIAVEVKDVDPAAAPAIAAAVANTGNYDEVYLWSSEPAIAEALREADAELQVGLTFAEMIQLAAMTDADEADYVAPGRFAQIPLLLNNFEILDQALADRCDRVGITLHAWTVSDPEQMQTLIDWGVEGIITDRPTTLESVLNQAGMP
jgi:glycerophosphoryl diester phosphodiesterase